MTPIWCQQVLSMSTPIWCQQLLSGLLAPQDSSNKYVFSNACSYMGSFQWKLTFDTIGVNKFYQCGHQLGVRASTGRALDCSNLKLTTSKLARANNRNFYDVLSMYIYTIIYTLRRHQNGILINAL